MWLQWSLTIASSGISSGNRRKAISATPNANPTLAPSRAIAAAIDLRRFLILPQPEPV